MKGPARNDEAAVLQAREIARKTLDEGYDPLLACREIDGLSPGLPTIPREVLDTFNAVASETDTIPLGDQRRYWSDDALRLRDYRAADYRARVYEVVLADLRRLLALLGP